MNLTQNPLQSEATVKSEVQTSVVEKSEVQTSVVVKSEVQTSVVEKSEVQTSVVEKSEAKSIYDTMDPSLEKAKCIYDYLQEDVQIHLIEQYIKPQLRGDDLIKEFDRLIESEACQHLEWQVLTDVVEKIIENKSALAQMCERNTLGFKNVYHQHFIQNKKTFILFDCPLSSMCAEFVMRKWH